MSTDKKKFKDTKVGQFLIEKIPNVVAKLAEDTVAGNVIEALIGSSDMAPEDKDVALEKLRIERAEIDGITRRWVADSRSSSWLAQNVRPVTLVFLTIAFVIGWGMQLEGLDTVKELLTIVFIGYFGSRGAEKIIGNKHHK